MRLLTSFAVLAFTASTAAADEVVLRNGAVFEGVVHEAGGQVVVKMSIGTMSFKKIDVAAIRKTDDALTVYEKKLESAATPEAKVELAAWARDKGLGRQADALLEGVIDEDPDHAGARRALGYEKHDGKWMRFDELMLSKGFVKVGNGWQPKDVAEAQRDRETAERLQTSRFDQESRARLAADHLERERLAQERRVLETQKELEMQKIVLERERLDILRRQDRYRVWDPIYDPYPVFDWRPSSGWQGQWPGIRAVPPIHAVPHHPGHGRPRPVPTGPAPLWTPPVR